VTVYTHRHQPVWLADPDGIGQLACRTCGAALTPRPTRTASRFEISALLVFLLALLAAGGWFWWLWLA
jgi:hypothetical protein